MRLHVSACLRFSISGSDRLFLNMRAGAGADQTAEQETLRAEPEAGSALKPLSGRRENRMLVVGASADLSVAFEADVTCAPNLRAAEAVRAWPEAVLDPARLGYLFASRYCEGERNGWCWRAGRGGDPRRNPRGPWGAIL